MRQHLENCMIYAVDFDGTLCEHKFPDIGAPNEKLIAWLIERKKAGDKIILWTNRMEPYLDNAVAWCAERGLYFDAVNDNIPEVKERYKDILKGKPQSRKITADIFIDDAACNVGLPFGNPGCAMSGCWASECPHRKMK